MQIYEKIFTTLKEKGMTQREFSEKTGISQSTISDWKNKGVNPSIEKVTIICSVLGLSLEELLEGKDGKKVGADYTIVHKESEEHFLIEVYRQSTEREKNRLLGYAQALYDMNMKK